MNVLILSCNTGGGHNSCAKAIAAELQSRGHTCRIDDLALRQQLACALLPLFPEAL